MRTPAEARRRALATAALALGFMALYAILLLTAVHWVGTDGDLYFALQSRDNRWAVPEATLRALDRGLAAGLSGDAAALEALPFNEREMTHLRDCAALFALLRKVRARLMPWAVALILGGAWVLRDRRRVRLCALLSPLAVLAPLGALALYAVFDFGAAFTLFHRLLFRNDLWLLDPATDLLIRICPESMFMAMGARIAVCGLLAVAAASAVAALLTCVWPRGKGENAWKTTTRRGPAPKRIDFGPRGTR